MGAIVSMKMDWQDEHKRRIAAFPEDIRKAHEHSSRHRAEVMGSVQCGCFYCCARFTPSEILKWIDKDDSGDGQTALCPKCGIDSVIGDKSSYDLSKEFLRKMHTHWF